jgi:hypothetical protein
VIAALAETGVSLNTGISTQDGTRSVRDLLQYTCRNFTLDQREIEWSALALALYLPPARGWQNLRGQRYSFDELAAELSRRFLADVNACDGTHILLALSVIVRVNEEEPVLSRAGLEKACIFLNNVATHLQDTQSATGSWRARGEDEATADQGGDLGVTSHHVEWLVLLPRDLFTDAVLRSINKACLFLRREIEHITAEDVRSEYCPFSHAVRALVMVECCGRG